MTRPPGRLHRRALTTLAAATGVATALAVPGLAVPARAATPDYPVSYDFTANALHYGDAANPPGANDWSCRPSAEHPLPVVLVHGTFGSAAGNWATYSALLADNGYCVFALTYGVPPQFEAAHVPIGGMNSIESSAAQLATFVSQVLQATGAPQVDIIGHSQGTLMPDYYVKFLGGAPYVHDYISLAPLWHGEGDPQFDSEGWTMAQALHLDPSAFPICKSCPEMIGGSPLLTKMGEGGMAVPGISYTNIVTTHDEVVDPYTSGIEEGMDNIVLQDHCSQDLSDHLEIASDPVASVIVLDTLDPAHARAVPCQLVLPAVGPPAP